MAGTTSDWEGELGRWLKPFLDRLGDKAQRQMCPLYVAGLIGPGDRKSVQPMAERLAPGGYDQLHHFVVPAKSPHCRGPSAHSRPTSAADMGQGSAASPGGRGLAHWRTPHVGREKILSC
jgi:hypothetical protein